MNVTDADRDKALDIIAEHQSGDADPFGEIADAIAAALAEERENARAPFLAVAESCEYAAATPGIAEERSTAYANGDEIAVHRISIPLDREA